MGRRENNRFRQISKFQCILDFWLLLSTHIMEVARDRARGAMAGVRKPNFPTMSAVTMICQATVSVLRNARQEHGYTITCFCPNKNTGCWTLGCLSWVQCKKYCSPPLGPPPL